MSAFFLLFYDLPGISTQLCNDPIGSLCYVYDAGGIVAYKPVQCVTKPMHLFMYMLLKVIYVHDFLHTDGVWMVCNVPGNIKVS